MPVLLQCLASKRTALVVVCSCQGVAFGLTDTQVYTISSAVIVLTAEISVQCSGLGDDTSSRISLANGGNITIEVTVAGTI